MHRYSQLKLNFTPFYGAQWHIPTRAGAAQCLETIDQIISENITFSYINRRKHTSRKSAKKGIHQGEGRLKRKTLPKALRTQALTALTSNFGLVGLVWLGRFGLAGLVLLGGFGLAGLVWQVWFGRFGLVGLVW